PLLGAYKLLPEIAVQELTEAYVFLRNLEHRLQYLDDKQTQTLPGQQEDQALIAAAMDYADYGALGTQLDVHRARVTQQFEAIFTSEKEAHPLARVWHRDDEESLEILRAAGYGDAQAALNRIVALRNSARVRQMPQASPSRMEQLVPMVVATAADMENPNATLERMLTLLESISRREAYLALLLQYPQALARGARLASASPWAAEYLARYPILLDELLDVRTLHSTPQWTELAAQLRAGVDAAAGDEERQMDMLRHFKHEQSLRLLARDLACELPLEKLSDELSALADLILAEVLRIAWQ